MRTIKDGKINYDNLKKIYNAVGYIVSDGIIYLQ